MKKWILLLAIICIAAIAPPSSSQVTPWQGATPVPVTQGGTGCSAASIACVNAISGGSLAGTLVGTSDTQTLTNKSIAATQLTGAIPAAQMPALTGDVTSSAGTVATTVAKINGATPAAVATSGSAADLTTGVVPAGRMPALTGDCTTSVGAVATACPKAANQQRVLGSLRGANFNSTADQAITIISGVTAYQITGVVVTNCSTSLTLAAGGFYPTTSKGGTPIVAAAQIYSALTGASVLLNATVAATPLVTRFTAATLYLSLTTGQGSAATCDVYVVGLDLT